MEPYIHKIPIDNVFLVPSDDLSEEALSAFLKEYVIIRINIADTTYNSSIHIPPASSVNKDRVISIHHVSDKDTELHINGEIFVLKMFETRSYKSNGVYWEKVILLDSYMNQILVPNTDLSAATLFKLLNNNHVLNIVLSDTNYAQEIHIPNFFAFLQNRVILIENNSSYEVEVFVNEQVHLLKKGEKVNYYHHRDYWEAYDEVIERGSIPSRTPKEFGVPVTTIVGFYDPKNELSSYIYPALHGAYGYIYDDSDAVTKADRCQLVIESAEGTLRFKLSDTRQSPNLMNRFHINIGESKIPRTAMLICNGRVVFTRDILPAKKKLTYTVTTGE